MDNKKREFDKILNDIKAVRIQGARNIARAAIKAYSLNPVKSSKEKLISSRPTEPLMVNVLNLYGTIPENQLISHFDEAQNEINKYVFKVMKNNDRIFTHCHSTNVISSLISSKKKGKKFSVINTETRPLFQGRKTAKDLKKAGITSTMIVDSGISYALEKNNKNDKIYATKVFLGADALTKDGIINKIGSKLVAEIAYKNKIPFYVIADSWKFAKNKIPIEQRSLNEVWDKAPKNIKIKNPAFEFVPKKYITKIITELGIMNYGDFVRKVK